MQLFVLHSGINPINFTLFLQQHQDLWPMQQLLKFANFKSLERPRKKTTQDKYFIDLLRTIPLKEFVFLLGRTRLDIYKFCSKEK